MNQNGSNGYETVALNFIKRRGQSTDGIGASSVRAWAQTLPIGSTVVDLGCGTGMPISKVLMESGMTVYGIDASPTLVNAFRQNFPNAHVACETVENSAFFNRKFDGIIAWGLMFLLPAETQALAILKASEALKTGGKFLFTSPCIETGWNDVMTGQYSLSLGADSYRKLLAASGLCITDEYEDEGENYYYSSVKI